MQANDRQKQEHIVQSLRRLAVQEGPELVLHIDKIVALRGGKNPLKRDPTNSTQKVDINDLELVSIGDSDNHGKCVRLIFEERMYATCGGDADTVIAWATESAATKIRSKIEKFPHVYFQQVVGKISVRGDELTLA